MRFRLLGPLEVGQGGEWRRLSAPKWRTLLAALLIGPGGPVSVERLTEELWPATPPSRATNQIHGYVSRLRRVLDDADGRLLATRSPGYELRLDPDDVDARLFERLAGQGETALREGRVTDAGRLLVQALDLWRGPALADVPPTPAVQAEADRLEERRLAALEAHIETELLRGRHAEVVAQLQSLVDAHPLREGFWAELMLALYRSGRQADALTAYQRLYRRLDEELGVQPCRPLRDLQERILRADPDLAPPPETDGTSPGPAGPSGVVVPHQLPADIADFTGREEELRRLDELLTGHEDREAVAICAVAGTGGVGKTTLAVHWGHRMADRFPDGQLYLDLCGYARTPPLEAGRALAQLLRGLGVPPESVPVDPVEAAALYRSRLAGRRALLLLDNASDASQVRPLLPGSPGCSVIVTSRNRLGGLVAREGGRQLEIDRLPTDEAIALLANVLGDERLAPEPEATAELAALCGNIPLPLCVAAANLAADPYVRIGDYVTRLRKDDRLEHLQIEGDPDTAVRAVFDLSYARLTDVDRRYFRMLSLVPGADFSGETVSALADASPADAHRVLQRLLDGHLIERRAAERYGFHGLMRLYAAERSDAEDTAGDRQRATARLLDWYVATTYAADRLVKPDAVRLPASAGLPSRPPDFHDHTGALSWLDAERANLVAATHVAAEQPTSPHAVLLADALRSYFHLRRYYGEWLTVARLGLSAAEARGDRYGQAAARSSLAQVTYHAGDRSLARAESERALEACQRAGWAEAEAFVLNLLGVLNVQAGRVDRALEQWERAVTLAASLGGDALTPRANLAIAYTRMGRLGCALEAHQRGVELARASQSFAVLGLDLADLAEDYRLLGRYERARQCLSEALRINRDTGSRSGIFTTLSTLVALESDTGCDAADRHLEECARIAVETGEPEMKVILHRMRADALLRTGAYGSAVGEYQIALNLAGEAGFHYEGVECLAGKAAALARLDHEAALGTASAAVGAARDAGYGLLEAHATTVLAQTYSGRQEMARAREVAENALKLHRATGHRLGEARTLRLLADIAEQDGDPGTGADCRERARVLFTDMGIPEDGCAGGGASRPAAGSTPVQMVVTRSVDQ